MSHPNLSAALERAGLAPISSETQQLIEFGVGRAQAGEEEVLEIAQAVWMTETHQGESLTILTREMLCVVLVPAATGMLRRKSSPASVEIPLTTVRDLIDDDKEFGGPVIFFFGAQDTPDFLLTFRQRAERDRFYSCVFAAHRGEFSRWGLQLDPNNYIVDFDRFYAEIVGSGIEEPMELISWVDQQYGDFRIDSALGLACEWRKRQLHDIKDPTGTSLRAALVGSPHPWSDVPESRQIIVRLGEQLFDAGELEPPYDERSYETGEPMHALDAGPTRLLALMTLAGYGHELRDPRAQKFIDAASPHLGAIPAGIYRQDLRDLWADVAPLPDVEASR
jgi:hypothetical protein